MKAILFCCLALVTFQAHALRITDDQDVLGQIDRRITYRPFEQEYLQKDRGEYEQEKEKFQYYLFAGMYCPATQDVKPARHLEHSVSAISADSVTLFWDTGVMETITKAAYEAAHGNPARLFLNSYEDLLGYQGKLILSEIRDVDYPVLNKAGQSITKPAIDIRGHFYGDEHPMEVGFRLTVLLDAPGVARIAYFDLNADDTGPQEPWYHLMQITETP